MRCFLIIMLIIFGRYCHGQIPESVKSNIEALIKDSSNAPFNGIVYVSQNGGESFSIVRGYSNFEEEIELTLHDQFVIGSISKQITAALILREYEKGKLSLNDPINRYLPELNRAWANKITIHHLLTHMHGIQNLESPPSFEAGTAFEYSQLGFELLAKILERISKDTFLNISNAFFNELGLTHTTHPQVDSTGNLPRGYTQLQDGTIQFETNSLQNYVPAGAFVSTVEDLVQWNTLLYAGQIVNDTTLQLMSTRHATREHPIFDEIEYGYGLTFKNGESDVQIGALGYAPGFVSSNFYFPKTGINVVVLQNLVCGLPNFRAVFQHHLNILEAIRLIR